MKKIAGLVVALVAIFCVTACGKSEKYDFTCTGKVDGYDMTVNGVVKNGKVTKIIAEEKYEASSAEEAKQGVALINGMGSLAQESGMTMTAKASGKTITMNITVDVAKAAAASDDDDDESNTLGIDLEDATKEAIIEAFEAQGLKCK